MASMTGPAAERGVGGGGAGGVGGTAGGAGLPQEPQAMVKAADDGLSGERLFGGDAAAVAARRDEYRAQLRLDDVRWLQDVGVGEMRVCRESRSRGFRVHANRA